MKKLIGLLFILPIILFGQIPRPLPSTYVNDFACVLSPRQISLLNDSISAIEDRSGVEIAVVLVNDLPPGMEIEDYALQIGRTWHVGNADNGIVYVAAINQHKQRLEVARHVEGDIPDVIALRITDLLKPAFRQHDYFSGLQTLIKALDARLNPDAMAQHQIDAAKSETGYWMFWVFLAVLLILAITGYLLYLAEKRRLSDVRRLRYERLNPSRQSHLLATEPSLEPLYGTVNNNRSYAFYPNDSYTPNFSAASDSSSNSSYGDWGGASSSFDSGFSGGGASNDW